MKRLPAAPAIEFRLITVPIDERLTMCGQTAETWVPEEVATKADALALAGRFHQALQDCWEKMDKIRDGQRRAPTQQPLPAETLGQVVS